MTICFASASCLFYCTDAQSSILDQAFSSKKVSQQYAVDCQSIELPEVCAVDIIRRSMLI